MNIIKKTLWSFAKLRPTSSVPLVSHRSKPWSLMMECCMESSLLSELIYALINIHQTQHQSLITLCNEQETQLQAHLQAQQVF